MLVCDSVRCFAHQLLHVLNTTHFDMDLLQNLSTLLQTKHDILLYLRKLDIGREFLQLLELRIRLFEERLLVLFAPEGQQRALLVALGQHLSRDVRLLVGEDGDASLVLV